MNIERLKAALKPFAVVADRYDADELDECRPDWIRKGIKKLNLEEELYCGRGGETLITLGHVLEARAALLGEPSIAIPVIDPFIAKVIAFYNAGIPNLPWDEMSQSRRESVINNYRSLIPE